jgi:diguanylate cyclase (GGDEF)-like protein
MSKTKPTIPRFDAKHLLAAGTIALASVIGGVLGSFGNAIVVGIASLVLGALYLAVSPLVLSLLQPRVNVAESLSPEKPIEAVPVPEAIPPDRIDALTGLANENGLMAWFAERGARLAADGKGIVVLSADLADFGSIERARGKKISDDVLIEVAGRVKSCTGADGIAARTSGDHFAAIASVVPEDSAEVAAEQAGKLADLIQRPVELSSGVVWISGCVGASYGPVSRGAEVLEWSREALQKAKRQGQGHYVVFNPGSQE